MSFVKFWVVLFTALVANAGELRVLSIGVEPDLLAHGKLDIYAQDAAFVAQAFEKNGAFKNPAKITLLKGADAKTSVVLNYISEISKEVKPEDTTVIFFSAHGNLNKKGDFYFSMAPEASSKNNWGYMNGKDFNRALASLEGRILVLLDTCEAEGIIRERVADNVSYMVASKISESSYGQESDSSIPHGYFVIALCEALSGLADSNKDRSISWQEFYDYIEKRTCGLEPSQTACSLIQKNHEKLIISRLSRKVRPVFIVDEIKSSNPFGCQDVSKAIQSSDKKFIRSVKFGSHQDDENAQLWNKKASIKNGSIEGEWQARWKSGGGQWEYGRSWIKIDRQRKYILFKGRELNYIFELKDSGKNKLLGHYMNLNDEVDHGAWVGTIISNQRIDGYWKGGRWDFRR